MEKFKEFIEKAEKNIKVADHILSVTYPLIKDPKLLLSVMQNVSFAFENTLNSILSYELTFKSIPDFENTFEIKTDLFKNKIMSKYKLKEDHLKAVIELKEIIKDHKDSSVEFSRKDVFVICSESFKMRTLSLEDIKKYITKAKLFIEEVNHITQKNEGIFGQR
jgi:hypothetical protein